MPFKKNVFLLGAGASADAGAPLMWNFLQTAQSLLRDPRSGLDDEERARFESVFRYQFQLRKAQAFVDVDLDNIEDLFGVLDLDERVGQPKAQTARENLVFLIVRTLELTIGGTELHPVYWEPDPSRNANAWERFAQVVARVSVAKNDRRASLVKTESDSIVTFNYDTLIEAAMLRPAVHPEFCLSDADDRRTGPVSGPKVRLIKLHGSAGWSHCPRCDDDRVHVFDDYAASCARPCATCGSPLSPLIVPPTWDKGASRSYLAPVWKAAWDEIRTAQRLFIVGYSAPPSDRHFRYFLASALANNYDLQDVVVVTDEAGREKAKATYGTLFTGAAAAHRLHFPKARGFVDFVSSHLWHSVGGPG